MFQIHLQSTAGERSRQKETINNKKSGKKGRGFRMVGSVLVGWLVWGCGMVSNPPSIHGVTKDLPRKKHATSSRSGCWGWDGMQFWVGLVGDVD